MKRFLFAGEWCVLFFFFLFLLLFSNTLFAKEKIDSLKRLHVGDKVPKLYISNIINTDDSDLYEFGKYDGLLILDFGSTICPPCIKSMIKLDSLRNRIGINKLDFIAVSPESQITIKSFMSKNNYNWKFIYEDSVLKNKLFPYIVFPHIAWIYKNKVIAITNSEEISEDNIKAVLEGRSLNLPEKSDFLDFYQSKSFLDLPNIRENHVYGSNLIKYTEGIPGGVSFNFKEKKFEIRNVSLQGITLYLLSNFNKNFERVPTENVIIDLDDNSKNLFNPNSLLIDKEKFLFSYHWSGWDFKNRSEFFEKAFWDFSKILKNRYGITVDVKIVNEQSILYINNL